ncbi:histidine phosphatase family protein, partial [Patescibacteria group bacterium]|nr:histidine phosphatase family protein [Patescibacteria group bacterium]
RAEAKENYPAEFEKIMKDQTYHDVAGSENYEEIKRRAIRIFDEISKKNYNTAAIISHGGIISTYVREVLTEGKNIKLGDCAILEIVKEGNEFALNCLSRTEIH